VTIATVPERSVPSPASDHDRTRGVGARRAGRGRSAVVVGAGFAGMAAALRLRARGMRVTLIDRRPELGGRARVFRRGGYTFDAGPTVITASFLLEELFAIFGERLDDHVDLRPVEPWYRVLFDDGEAFDYAGSVDRMCEQIARFNPADQDGFRRMSAACEEIYRIGFERLGDQPFDRLGSMLASLPQMIRLRTHRSMYAFVSSHLRDERLRRVFTFQPLLVGGNPFHTSCIYSLIQPLERKFGVHYAMGGTGAIVEALGGLMRRHGVEVALGEEVERIETEGRRVARVRTRGGGRFEADLIVSGGDPVTLYDRLLPERGPHTRTRARARRMKLSMGLFVLYFGSRRTYPDLAHHTILLSDRYRSLLSDIFDGGRLPNDPSLYVHAPTRSDPSMAPPGREAFYALAPVPNLRLFDDWETRAAAYHDLVLDRIETAMAPGLGAHVEQDFHVTPRYFETELGSAGGAGFSIQPTLRQSAYFRFHNKCPHYENLYLVGAGTHPGAGLPGVLSSAKVLEGLLTRV